MDSPSTRPHRLGSGRPDLPRAHGRAPGARDLQLQTRGRAPGARDLQTRGRAPGARDLQTRGRAPGARELQPRRANSTLIWTAGAARPKRGRRIQPRRLCFWPGGHPPRARARSARVARCGALRAPRSSRLRVPGRPAPAGQTDGREQPRPTLLLAFGQGPGRSGVRRSRSSLLRPPALHALKSAPAPLNPSLPARLRRAGLPSQTRPCHALPSPPAQDPAATNVIAHPTHLSA